ncbi:MAG: hypothetical protein ABR510_06320 [Trueperaceae bacterium]
MSVPPADLARALAPLVRRLRLQRRAVDALSAGAAATVGAAIGLVVARLGTAWSLDPGGSAIGVVAIVLAVRAVQHAQDPITPLAAARRAERDPAWRERLTTALEHGNRDGIVPGALLADALERARSLDVVGSAPWRWPRRTLTILAAGTVAFGALVALPAPMPAPLGTTGTGGGASAPSAAAVADLARDVAAEARRSRDAYLAALAEQLDDLAEAAGTGPLEATARAELDEVLEALAAASGGAITAEQLQANLIARDAALQAEAAVDPDGSTPPPATRRAGSAAEPGSAPDFSDVFTRTLEGSETEQPAEVSAGGGSSQNAPPGEGEFDPSLLEEVRDASPFDGPAPVGAPGELIGAADEAGAGDSRLAGRGSQALEGAAEGADFTDAAAEAVALSGSERDEGRRIEVELPPTEAWEGYDPTVFVVGAWRATPESPVNTDPIALRYREAAGRYFLPSQETAASR